MVAHPFRNPIWFVWAGLIGLFLCIQAAQAQRLTWLGTLGGEFISSVANSVSSDGSVVVGSSCTASENCRAFRWTAAGGMENLGTLGGSWSAAYGVSSDGSVVVGVSPTARVAYRAFRWTATRGMEDLGTLGGSWSWAYASDGSVVVGWADNAGGYERAFRWTATGGMEDLGTLGGDRSWAQGVSSDGSVVVGWSTTASSGLHAFRWTEVGGMEDLGTLGGDWSWAYGVSSDGSVVVGWADNANGERRAFRWTAAGGMEDLGTLGGSWSWAYGVSSDGSVVVGWADNASSGPRAFRWTATGGMEDLNQTYAHLLFNGSYLEDARDISPDGRFIVGRGYNAATGRYEAFLLDTRGEIGIVKDAAIIPTAFALHRNYPNPFNSSTTIAFDLPQQAWVQLTVYDLLGREVRRLVEAALAPGRYKVIWDGRDAAGQPLAGGVYVYRLETGEFTQTRRMVLMR
jgi:probable HAF family extracellular repeat protein